MLTTFQKGGNDSAQQNGEWEELGPGKVGAAQLDVVGTEKRLQLLLCQARKLRSAFKSTPYNGSHCVSASRSPVYGSHS